MGRYCLNQRRLDGADLGFVCASAQEALAPHPKAYRSALVKFELIVNRKTVTALGFDLPASIEVSVDQVIE
jgi:hypothetical protein